MPLGAKLRIRPSTQRADAQSAVQRVACALLSSRIYSPTEVPIWTAEVSEAVALALRALSSAYKYAVMCVVMQREEAGLHISSTCFWDAHRDGSFSVRVENQTMHCVVNVFAVVY